MEARDGDAASRGCQPRRISAVIAQKQAELGLLAPISPSPVTSNSGGGGLRMWTPPKKSPARADRAALNEHAGTPLFKPATLRRIILASLSMLRKRHAHGDVLELFCLVPWFTGMFLKIQHCRTTCSSASCRGSRGMGRVPIEAGGAQPSRELSAAVAAHRSPTPRVTVLSRGRCPARAAGSGAGASSVRSRTRVSLALLVRLCSCAGYMGDGLGRNWGGGMGIRMILSSTCELVLNRGQ